MHWYSTVIHGRMMLWLPNDQCSNTIYGLAAASRDLDLQGFGMAVYRDGIVWIYTVTLGRRSIIQSKGLARQSKAESWQRMALKRFTMAMCDQSRSGCGMARQCELCMRRQGMALLHTARALRSYAQQRRYIFPHSTVPTLFLSKVLDPP